MIRSSYCNTIIGFFIDYAIDFAAKKKWKAQSKEDIQRAMTQKLGEIKRNYNQKLKAVENKTD